MAFLMALIMLSVYIPVIPVKQVQANTAVLDKLKIEPMELDMREIERLIFNIMGLGGVYVNVMHTVDMIEEMGGVHEVITNYNQTRTESEPLFPTPAEVYQMLKTGTGYIAENGEKYLVTTKGKINSVLESLAVGMDGFNNRMIDLITRVLIEGTYNEATGEISTNGGQYSFIGEYLIYDLMPPTTGGNINYINWNANNGLIRERQNMVKIVRDSFGTQSISIGNETVSLGEDTIIINGQERLDGFIGIDNVSRGLLLRRRGVASTSVQVMRSFEIPDSDNLNISWFHFTEIHRIDIPWAISTRVIIPPFAQTRNPTNIFTNMDAIKEGVATAGNVKNDDDELAIRLPMPGTLPGAIVGIKPEDIVVPVGVGTDTGTETGTGETDIETDIEKELGRIFTIIDDLVNSYNNLRNDLDDFLKGIIPAITNQLNIVLNRQNVLEGDLEAIATNLGEMERTLEDIEKAVAVLPGQIADDLEITLPGIINDSLAETHDKISELERSIPLAIAGTGTFDFGPLKNDYNLTQLFPFCIPFDFVRMIGMLQEGGQSPPRYEAEILGYTWVLDFAEYQYIADVIRMCMLFAIILYIMIGTGRLIKW
jgi:hypothetical protein